MTIDLLVTNITFATKLNNTTYENKKNRWNDFATSFHNWLYKL